MYKVMVDNEKGNSELKRMFCPIRLKKSYWVNIMVDFIPSEIDGQQRVHCIDYFYR